MSETRREYLKRITLVLDEIEQHLDEDLSLSRLAEKAHYSPYHFHRVFLTIVGEHLQVYVNRKRIERIASILLVDTDRPLKDLAYTYGFNSDNSFSRAFKKYYGVSPTTFRAEGKEVLRKIGIEPFSSEKYLWSIDNLLQWMNMNARITITERPAVRLASLSTIGEVEKIGSMFQRLMDWGDQQGVLATTDFNAITLYHDNPHVTQTSDLRISAGVTIDRSIAADGEIRELTLESGIYAVGRFEIVGAEIATAWKGMCTWVIDQDLEFRDGHYFEVYHNDHTTHPEGKFILDICIPIHPSDRFPLGVPQVVTLADESSCDPAPGYHELIGFMKDLRAHLQQVYELGYRFGSIYRGHPEYSYFSLSPEPLKVLKLKYVIVLDHKKREVSICLSGQNKSIRKKYWTLFQDSNWDRYPLVKSIDDSLYILDHVMVKNASLSDKQGLIDRIEEEADQFMNEMTEILVS